MRPTTLLRQALQTHLNWHGARLNFLAHFLVAVYRVKTVNLVELASAFGGQASSESHYKRLQRFFRSFELDYTAFAQVVVTLMRLKEQWVLTRLPEAVAVRQADIQHSDARGSAPRYCFSLTVDTTAQAG